MSVLIRGGRIVTAADNYIADIFIEDEQVSLIGNALDVQADETIDATGRYVLPGGVDVHTHMDTVGPHDGASTVDNHYEGTVSGAFGGTTTIVDFATQYPGESLTEALDNWHNKLERNKPVIDVGFHLIVTDLETSSSLHDLAKLPEEGVTSYKLFMAHKGSPFHCDDDKILEIMKVAAENGSLVMMHAENADAIDYLIKESLSQGNTAPKYHALTRPPETEGEATNRAIQLARIIGCPVYIVHVSCLDAIEPIERARHKGWDVWGETCPQYLRFDFSDIDQPVFEEAAKYVYTPPPREKQHVEGCWDAIRNDALSVVATDHAPYNIVGQKDKGKDDFSKIPNGPPGIEERLKILHEFGIRGGRLTWNRLVELTATNPAKIFGLYPRKGTIAAGSDADIVIFDAEKKQTISRASHHSTCDYNLFEGTEVTGIPETVLVRGQLVIENGELVAQPGTGQFVKRARYGEQLDVASAAV
jgi:dihydropyrimidinase